MKSIQLVGVILLFAVLLACSNRKEVDKNESEIKQLIRDCTSDFEQGNIASFVNRGTKKMTFFTLDGRYLKKKEIIPFLQPMFDRWWNGSMHIDSLEIFMDQQFAWAKYRSTFSFTAPSGKTEMKNLHTVIFMKNDVGDWKVHHFHMSNK